MAKYFTVFFDVTHSPLMLQPLPSRVIGLQCLKINCSQNPHRYNLLPNTTDRYIGREADYAGAFSRRTSRRNSSGD